MREIFIGVGLGPGSEYLVNVRSGIVIRVRPNHVDVRNLTLINQDNAQLTFADEFFKFYDL